ncbi:PIN/TRAM domain-containing protein [Candidatus Solincola tengchongensis]|uniref:PIN/TRAM domain-containing protein n=1 Tax=Candidatus Solincola tengchongensis TaxID=2900693 RepID=UPI00257AC07B|nr:PIN/TRAM domain-containing protein [Candidatus Solincola tengchongensis]
MVVLIVRLIFMVIGGIGGYELGELMERSYLQNLDPTYSIIGFIVSIIVCVGLGFVLGGAAGRYTAKLLNRFEVAIQDIPGTDLLMGAVGIIAGFLIAFLPSMILFRSYPGWLFAVVLYAVCGVIGYIVAVQKKDDLIALFRPSRHALAAEEERKPVAARILDTSAIVDGRIADICQTGFLEGQLVVPRFVLNELQAVADSEDPLKRNRGRRGLEVLNALQRQERVEVRIEEADFPELSGVDAKLVALAKALNLPIMTTDFNLNKIAELQGVRVLNVNELANSLKPVVLPGETLTLTLIREGKEPGQGVGYLDDGTMVVVEGGKRHIGKEVRTVVTSTLQTAAGRMIFASLSDREG